MSDSVYLVRSISRHRLPRFVDAESEWLRRMNADYADLAD